MLFRSPEQSWIVKCILSKETPVEKPVGPKNKATWMSIDNSRLKKDFFIRGQAAKLIGGQAAKPLKCFYLFLLGFLRKEETCCYC